MNEIWKPVPGFNNEYFVSNLGNVKSFKKSKEKHLKKVMLPTGYLCHTFSLNGKIQTVRIHQLVAMAFLGHKLNGMKLVIDHINNDKLDNRLENIQIISQRKNTSKKNINKTSKYIGVCWYKTQKKWLACIRINGIKKHLGLFKTELEASQAYQNKLKTL
jgi:hypothetical protein